MTPAEFLRTRQTTEQLTSELTPEDMQLQSMPDASPTKWHLAHTTWFFEEFVLSQRQGYRPFHPRYRYLFNSYYDTVGDRHPRPQRGMLSRPSVEEIRRYREHVNAAMAELLQSGLPEALRPVVELGCHHEQQHQELLLTDLLHAFSCNVLRPAFAAERKADSGPAPALRWQGFEAGVREVGAGPDGFAFDNERPRHRVFLEPFSLATRLVTNAEYEAFIEDGGYERPELWLSEGWDVKRQQGWTAPLYWERGAEGWSQFTLRGMRRLEPAAPVLHVSLYEAAAYAQWAQARLPTEFEWELAAQNAPLEGNLLERGELLARPAPQMPGLTQLHGDAWEWTSSAYSAYPGYRPLKGALGEYNGKFMCSQYVLRGGSFATSRAHLRSSYRNFFPPSARWQFCGVRLARSE